MRNMAGDKRNLSEGMDADVVANDERMSDDSSGSDNDANEDAEELKQAEELEEKIRSSPYDYQSHVNYIKFLRKTGNLDKLRGGREAMSKIFPLTAELWLDWIKDESQLASTDEEKEKLMDLFERAVKDYMSVALWLEYAQFSIGLMSAENGIERVRQIFERAVTAVGLHVSQGALIWEAYREFELVLLSAMQPPSDGMMSEEESELYLNQRNRVYNIFKRQLSLPLFGMENTFQELKEWSEASVEHPVEQQYKRARAKLEQIKPYEENLMASDPPSLQSYLSYLDYEEKEGEPARIQCLYERAITDHCLVPNLWKRYMAYLDLKLKVEAASLPCHERSVRNCPWSGELWTSHIKALERFCQQHSKIKETMEEALQAGFSTGQEYQQLWLTYIDYMRRKIDWSLEGLGDVDDLRNTFEKAVDHLGQYYETHGDLHSSVMMYWAKVEALFCNNIEKSREIWNEITNHGRATDAQTWLEYANFERIHGDSKHLRKVLMKGMYAATDWPETLGDMLIKFEREEGEHRSYKGAFGTSRSRSFRSPSEMELNSLFDFRPIDSSKMDIHSTQKTGSLETLDVATEKYEAHMKRVLEKREKVLPLAHFDALVRLNKIVLQAAAKEAQQTEQKKATRAEKKTTKKATEETASATKGPAEDRPKPGKRKAKEQVDEDGFKIPACPEKEPSTEEPAPKRAKDEKESLAHGEKVEHDPAKDEQTVFLSNLLYDADEEAIKDIFKHVGTVEELRMVRDFKGRFKGFAYLVFSNREEAEAALKLDRTPLEGRPVFISKCNRKKEFGFQCGLEKNKLFVKNIPFSMTQQELEELFSKYGDLKEVRLVTYRNGHSKGIAYVEYGNETAATVALVQTDGMQLGKQVLSVAISNPPARGSRQHEPQKAQQVASLGGGHKETGLRGRGRTQVSLMPRVIQRCGGAQKGTENTPTEAADDGQSKGLSNADFRSLLVKK